MKPVSGMGQQYKLKSPLPLGFITWKPLGRELEAEHGGHLMKPSWFLLEVSKEEVIHFSRTVGKFSRERCTLENLLCPCLYE